jgi:hypothetical protein
MRLTLVASAFAAIVTCNHAAGLTDLTFEAHTAGVGGTGANGNSMAGGHAGTGGQPGDVASPGGGGSAGGTVCGESPPGQGCPVACTGGCDAGTCTIVCLGVEACRDATLTCPADFACSMECFGGGARRDGTIRCPAAYACDVLCSGNKACRDTTVDGVSGPVAVDCSGVYACRETDIECPADQSCAATCTDAQVPPNLMCGLACSCDGF